MSIQYEFDSTINQKLNTQRASSLLKKQQNLGISNDITNTDDSVRGLAAVSTNIKIRCNDRVIGMIQSFNTQENRTVTKVQSVGVEGVIQAVPGNTNGGQINAQRLALYGERVYDAFGMDNWSGDSKKLFSTLKDQRLPFEIEVKTETPDGMPPYIEIYRDCWISSYKKTYAVQTITVSEDVTIMYADVDIIYLNN